MLSFDISAVALSSRDMWCPRSLEQDRGHFASIFVWRLGSLPLRFKTGLSTSQPCPWWQRGVHLGTQGCESLLAIKEMEETRRAARRGGGAE